MTRNQRPDVVFSSGHLCDWSEMGERCGDTPTAFVGNAHHASGENYYACEEHFADLREWLNAPSPVVLASDGPRAVLADGSVACLHITPHQSDRELIAIESGQGQTVFGHDASTPVVSVAIVDEPNPRRIEAVEDRLAGFGFPQPNTETVDDAANQHWEE